MGFHHRRVLTDCQGKSTRSGPRHGLGHRVADSGRIVLARRWGAGTTRAHIDLGSEPKSQAVAASMLTDFHVCRGAAYGLRYKDWRDWSTAATGDVFPTVSDPTDWTYMGVATAGQAVVEIKKGYGETAAQTRFRRISKVIPPKLRDGTADPDHFIALSLSASNVVPDLGSGLRILDTHFSVDWDQGSARFPVAMTGGENLWGCFTYHVPARFSKRTDGGLQCVIEPGTDAMRIRGAGLEECGITMPGEHHDEWNHGGHYSKVLGVGDYSVNFYHGMVQTLTPWSNGQILLLPDSRDFTAVGTAYGGVNFRDLGGPYLIIENNSASGFSFDLRSKSGTSLVPAITLAAQSIVQLNVKAVLEGGWFAG